MNKYQLVILGLLLSLFSFEIGASNCPDPATTSLQWGVPPSPWVENPFSPNSPQGEENTRFVRANILVAGYGKGVTCTYENSVGEYSIWWAGKTKIPPPTDYNWVKGVGGFVCDQGLTQCEFYVIAK